MRRRKLSKRSNRKNFSRSASKIHRKNLKRRVSRGGYRL